MDQSKTRIEKLSAMRALGNPYPNDFKPTHLAMELHETYKDFDKVKLEGVSETFKMAGRVMGMRGFGKAAFFHIQDRSAKFQLYIAQDSVGEKEFKILMDFIDVGDIMGVEGNLFRTKTNELTLKVTRARILSKCLHVLPEKWHGLKDTEIRYRQRYLDLIVNPPVREIFKTRSRIVQHIRNYFLTRDYLEVETPMMHPIAGGALARPFVTHHNTLDMDLYLRVAPELYLKRLVVGGMERVFEINRNFRNEGISIQHNPEFSMLEFYETYATYEDFLVLTEDLLNSLSEVLFGKDEITFQDEKISFRHPFQKYTMEEAIVKFTKISKEELKNSKALEHFLISQKIDLPMHKEVGFLTQTIFDHFVQPKLIQPTFILQYPLATSPLSRKNEKDPSVVDRFELFIYGREIANAFSELNDPIDQRERLLAQSRAKKEGDPESHQMDEDFVRALEYGMPPTAGEGVGIDRLVMLFTNAPSIRDVILFPQLRKG